MKNLLKEISSRLNGVEYGFGQKRQPKYRQLSETILSMINEGILKPGDNLPGETTLAGGLPYSLGTIQQALRYLSELGVVKRVQRSGTVITGRTQEIHDLWQYRFINKEENAVYPVYSRVINMDRYEHKGDWSQFLGDDKDYVRIVREIDVGRKLMAITSFYIMASRFAQILELSPSELEGVHLSAVMQRLFGITTVRTNNRVVCSVIPDQICLRLGLPSGARGLVCQVLGYAPNNQPLSFQQVYIPADVEPMEFRELKPTWSS